MARGVNPGSASDGTGQYPTELAKDVRLKDGATVHLRPIRPGDGEHLMEFHEHLSSQSAYRRYFFIHPRLSATAVEHLTHVDYVDRLALVAEDRGKLIAVGRYERLSGVPDAEVAFVVADEYQRQGIGMLLLEHLADAARERGIASFVAQTMADNSDMIDVFMNSGFHVTSSTDYGTVSVRFPITHDADSWSVHASRHLPEPGG